MCGVCVSAPQIWPCMGRLLWEGSVVCVVYLGELCRGLACCGRVWWSSPSAALNCRLRLSAGTRTMINNESEADWNSLPRRLCGSVQLRAHPGPTASASSSLVSILAKFARCAPVIKHVCVCVCVCVCQSLWYTLAAGFTSLLVSSLRRFTSVTSDHWRGAALQRVLSCGCVLLAS